MNPQNTLSSITCEFETIDMADLGIGRLLKSTGGVRSIHVRRCGPPAHYSDPAAKDTVLFPPVLPAVSDFSSGYAATANPSALLYALHEPKDSIEPRRIRSVTAEIICNRKNVRDIAGRLTSLGATHIHIR